MKIDTCIKQSDVTQVRSALLKMLKLARKKELTHEDLNKFESLFGEADDLLITLANELQCQKTK